MTLSEQVGIIIDILEQCKSDAVWYERQKEDAEAEETDLAHELVGAGVEHRVPPKGNERNKIGTRMQKAMLTRRIAKDYIIASQPLRRFLEEGAGAKLINQFKQIQGELRKIEGDMLNRKYKKRHDGRPETNKASEKKLNKLISDWRRRAKSKY